jgi:hypothetical protein
MKLIYTFVFVFGLLAIFSSATFAQVTTGTPPFGSFGGGPADTINLANLNVHLTIPVLNKPGRGIPFVYNITYDNSIWYPVNSNGTNSWQPCASPKPQPRRGGSNFRLRIVEYKTRIESGSCQQRLYSRKGAPPAKAMRRDHGPLLRSTNMSLFDNMERFDLGPAFYAEPKFTYLNRSHRLGAQRIRELLDSWFSRYPEQHRIDLRGRFRSTIDAHHLAAFFELLLHELLLRLGARVQVHPPLEGRARRPDFLVTSANGQRYYLEAAIATDESREAAAARARMNAVYDVLNRLASPNFFIGISLREYPVTPPPGNDINRFLSRRLSNLNPDELATQFEAGGFEALPHWLYEHQGWKIEFFPMPKSPEIRGQAGVRPIGLHFEGWQWLDTRVAIRDSVVGKAGRYGEMDLSYVIAVNALGDHVDRTDIMEALFGKEQFFFRADLGNQQRPECTRKPDGVWTSPGRPRYTRVSAVLAADSLGPSTIPWASMCLYHNPWAAKPYEGELTQLPRAVPRGEDSMEWLDGKTLAAIFGLPANWPGH